MPNTSYPCHPRDYSLPVRIHVRLSRFRSWLRVKLNRYRFRSLGKDFSCGDSLFVIPNHVTIGDHVYIGRNGHLAGLVDIGDYCLIASYVAFVGGDHPTDVKGYPMCFAGGPNLVETVLEKDVWIGHGVTIMQGVRIGEGSVVAAGAIVTRDIEPYSIVAGNPAKEIRKRFDPEQITEHKRLLLENGFV